MLPRDVLNKLKWSPNSNFEKYELVIIHRGAPGDVKAIKCRDILDLGRGFFEASMAGKKTMIPYHRIIEIREINGKAIWKKRG